MRKFIRASVLILALAIPTFAGDIPNGVTGDIPNGVTATGYIPNGVTGEIPNNDTGDIPYGDTLQPTFIESLLSLFSLI
jgi:hypothetical protein